MRVTAYVVFSMNNLLQDKLATDV